MQRLKAQIKIQIVTNQEFSESIIKPVLSFIDNQTDTCLGSEEINDIKTAVLEAVENAFTFAYPGRKGAVSISVSIYKDNTIEVSVKDFGSGIADISKARESLFTTKEGHSGMGFTIMETFSKNVIVKSEFGRGTTVILQF